TFSPVLAVYQGDSAATLSSNASSFGYGCPGFSTLDMDLGVPTNCGSPPCAQTYQIAVGGTNQNAGTAELALIFIPEPENDDFANRTALTGLFLTVTGSVISASQEAGEVIAGVSNNLRTVWYSWTAPAITGAVTLRMTGIGLYLGRAPGVGIFQGNA